MKDDRDIIERYPLRSLYINPTGYCNLCCRHCWLSPEVKGELSGDEGEITPEEVIAVIEAARPLGLSSIKFTGGEPLLRGDLDGVIEHCAKTGIEILIETNGTLIDESLADLLARCDVGQVSVSIDSYDEATHDRLRGSKGAYRRAMEGIRLLLEREVFTQIVYSLYKDNMAHFEGFLEQMRDLDVVSIKINTISPVGRGEDLVENGLAPSIRELLGFRDDLAGLVEGFHGHVDLDLPMAFKGIEEMDTRGCGVCSINNILGILSDGSVSICGIGYVDDELVFGNIRRDGPGIIEEVWRNNVFIRGLREGVPKKLKGVCSKCVFRKLCNGCCRAEVYHNTKDIYAPYWFCQEAYDSGLFPATRIMPEVIRK